MDVKTAIALAAVLASGLIQAKVEMGTPFSDRAVLQRGVEVPVWGKATSGARVSVAFAGAEVAADADMDGNWSLKLPPMEASSENRTMTVTERKGGAETDRIEIADVLVGEVWFASGQSNMECPIWGGDTRYRDGAGALVTAMDHLPNIRFAKNIHAWSAVPARAKSQGWARFEPQRLAACPWASWTRAGAVRTSTPGRRVAAMTAATSRFAQLPNSRSRPNGTIP